MRKHLLFDSNYFHFCTATRSWAHHLQITKRFLFLFKILLVPEKIKYSEQQLTIFPPNTQQYTFFRSRMKYERGYYLYLGMSVCSAPGGGGTPMLPDGEYLNLANGGGGVTPKLRLDGEPPCQDWIRYPPVRTGWGTPPCQDWMGIPPLIKTGWGSPRPSVRPPPPSGDRATGQALATLRAVCLLRLRRRTFLHIG